LFFIGSGHRWRTRSRLRVLPAALRARLRDHRCRHRGAAARRERTTRAPSRSCRGDRRVAGVLCLVTRDAGTAATRSRSFQLAATMDSRVYGARGLRFPSRCAAHHRKKLFSAANPRSDRSYGLLDTTSPALARRSCSLGGIALSASGLLLGGLRRCTVPSLRTGDQWAWRSGHRRSRAIRGGGRDYQPDCHNSGALNPRLIFPPSWPTLPLLPRRILIAAAVRPFSRRSASPAVHAVQPFEGHLFPSHHRLTLRLGTDRSHHEIRF